MRTTRESGHLVIQHRHALGIGARLERGQALVAGRGAVHHDFNLAVGDGLAEEVVRLDGQLGVLVGLVERLVELERDLELGQDILLHLHLQPALGVADPARDHVGPFDQVAGQLEIGAGNAVLAGFAGLLEDDVVLGIGDGEGDGLVADRLEVGAAQGEAADVDNLTGLVNRLVAAEHQLPRAFQLHFLGDDLQTFRRFRLDDQGVLAVLPIGRLETRLGGAENVGARGWPAGWTGRRGVLRARW